MTTQRIITGLALCISLAACSAAPVEQEAASSSATAFSAAMEAFDRNPCELWAGAFGWFDPSAPDGNGMLAPGLYASLCADQKPAAASKTEFCAELNAGLVAATIEEVTMTTMMTVLCGNNLCVDLKVVRHCESPQSDQSAWVQDYATNHGCDAGKLFADCK